MPRRSSPSQIAGDRCGCSDGPSGIGCTVYLDRQCYCVTFKFKNGRQRAAAYARRKRSRSTACSSNTTRSAAGTKPCVGSMQTVGKPTLKSCSRGRASATARQFAARRGARRCRRRASSGACPSSCETPPQVAREIGLGRVDPLQRPLKGTVYNASLVNCHLDMDTANGNIPVSGVKRIESVLAIIAFYN
jgi:hypothetical protein